LAVAWTGPLGLTYDGVGNRLTQVLNPGTGPMNGSNAFPAISNRLGTISLVAGGTRGLTYAAAGKVTLDIRAGGNYGRTRDQAWRVAAFSIGGVAQAQYRYNRLGQQITRSLIPSITIIQSVYGPDGNRIAEYNLLTGALMRQYVRLSDAPIAVIEGGVVSYMRADHSRRPAFATNATGAVV
jgi:hypothetical protein